MDEENVIIKERLEERVEILLTPTLRRFMDVASIHAGLSQSAWIRMLIARERDRQERAEKTGILES